MSRHSKKEHRATDSGLVEVKSKFDAEFRRFSLSRDGNWGLDEKKPVNTSTEKNDNEKGNEQSDGKSSPTNSTESTRPSKFDDFVNLLSRLHNIEGLPLTVSYTDPRDGDLLPINNDDNLARAINSARPLLRLFIQRKGESLEEVNGYGTFKPRNIISSILGGTPGKPRHLPISNPHDFRQVSSIIDVDVVPETCRRVRLVKHGSERPLGFYIRDGTSFRVTQDGVHRVPGIFISRLVPGGLAESTGLLAVNDEVLEVNGIEVAGKTLDQVTDMMVANSWNLIITVKPANQRTVTSGPPVRRGSLSRNSQMSSGSRTTTGSDDDMDQDEVVDLTQQHTAAAATPSQPPTLTL